MATCRENLREIRKFRKKLRQIEYLELVDRELSEDERAKIAKKSTTRGQLLSLLVNSINTTDTSQADSSFNSKTSFTEYCGSESDNRTSPAECGESHKNHVPGDSGDFRVPENDQDLRNEPIDKQSLSAAGSEHPRLQDVDSHIELHARLKHDGSVADHTPSPSSTKQGTSTPKQMGIQKQPDKLKTQKHGWRAAEVDVSFLSGHSDIINDVQTDGKIIVSASRDTTIKVWDIESKSEMRSLGGHGNSVTCISLFPQKLSKIISGMLTTTLDHQDPNEWVKAAEFVPGQPYTPSGSSLERSADDQLLISGSLDCSVRLWSLNSGQTVQTIYTFDPIMRLCLVHDAVIATGSDGGKISLWDIIRGTMLHSVLAYSDSISGLKFSDMYLYSMSCDGSVKVHELRDGTLHCVHESDDVKSPSGTPLTLRSPRVLLPIDNKIFIGDEGANIKIINWKAGVVIKLANNPCEYGWTDALCAQGNVLVSSAYDIDNGYGFINVRALNGTEYLVTLNDSDTGRILCVSCWQYSENVWVIVTGGLDLKIWMVIQFCPKRPDITTSEENTIRATYVAALSQSALDSDIDSESQLSDTDSDSDAGPRKRRRFSLDTIQTEQSQNGWFSWCSLL